MLPLNTRGPSTPRRRLDGSFGQAINWSSPGQLRRMQGMLHLPFNSNCINWRDRSESNRRLGGHNSSCCPRNTTAPKLVADERIELP